MPSSNDSPEPPPSVPPDQFDFAEAAETLITLQKQLKHFEALNDTLNEVAESGSALAQSSQELAQAQQRLAEQTEAPSDINASVAQSVAALHESVRSINTSLQDVMDELNAMQNANGRTRRRSGGSVWNAATVSMLTGLVFIIVLLVVQWQTTDVTVPDELAEFDPEAISAPAPEPGAMAPALYPHHAPVESLADVRMQVLNGVGVGGLASRFQERLEAFGVQVPNTDNLPAGQATETRLYVHRNAFDLAEQVADEIGLDRRRVLPGPPADAAHLDMTLVLGADYASLQ